MANGAIYCNLWDALHPGTIPMSRVDFTAKYDYDFAKNWKLMQNGFQKAQINKLIPVQRLIKARYQDNLEFLQWMYKYARDTYNGDPDDPTYDAIGRRSKSKGGKDFTGSSNKNKKRRGKENSRSNRLAPSANSSKYGGSKSANRSTNSSQRGSVNNGNSQQMKAMHAELEDLKNENQALVADRDGLQSKLDGVAAEHDELSNIAKNIEKERDFYFNKVVAIENLLKAETNQDNALLKQIFEILYEAADEEAPQN